MNLPKETMDDLFLTKAWDKTYEEVAYESGVPARTLRAIRSGVPGTVRRPTVVALAKYFRVGPVRMQKAIHEQIQKARKERK